MKKYYRSLVQSFHFFCSSTIYLRTENQILLSFVGVMLIVYVLMWFHANHIRHVELSVNNSTIEISAGDVFQSEGLKIIAFNEYFDTQVDENIISSRTLNGQFIKKYAHDVESLDHLIQENQHAQECKINVNQNRLVGKQIQYKLGTIVPMDDFFILAFSNSTIKIEHIWK